MLTETAWAKINLYLEVRGIIEGGYHEIETVFHSISLADTITLESASDHQKGIRLVCDDPSVGCDEQNTALKAAKLFFKMTEHRISTDDQGLIIKIGKSIPPAAGLGGGSADAAAVIRGLNRLYGVGLTYKEMVQMGRAIGADVPFCVKGGAALGRGRGDDLEPVTPWDGVPVLVCKPPWPIRTKEAYDALDSRPRSIRRRGGCLAVVRALQERDIEGLGRAMYNAFEEWALDAHPQLAEYKRLVRDAGAVAAMMTGSGPAIIALFDSPEKAGRARNALEAKNVWVRLAFTSGEMV